MTLDTKELDTRETKVYLVDNSHLNNVNEEEQLTTAQVADVWTARAIQMGYLHYYKADSVRQAGKQGRIVPSGNRIGTNRLFRRSDAEQVDIRPWMRILYQRGKDAQRRYPCARCGTEVPSEELAWRTWYWCAKCQNDNPHLWQAYKWEHYAAEETDKRDICRVALYDGRRSRGA